MFFARLGLCCEKDGSGIERRTIQAPTVPAPDTINFPDQGGCNDLGFPPSAPAVENESYDGAVTAEVIEAEYTLWLGRARAVDVSIGPR